MKKLPGIAVLFVLPLLGDRAGAIPPAQESAADELVRRAEVQSAVDDALAIVRAGAPNGDVEIDRFVEAALSLAERKPEVLTPLGLELDQTLPDTFFFVAYTLGLTGGEEAETLLREALARAEAESSAFAVNRKGWICFGLGLLGRDDAVDLLNEGRHRSAGVPIFPGTSSLEAVALLTAPASVPRLVRQLERYTDKDDPNGSHRARVIQALGRVADPGSIPALTAALGSPNGAIRHHAARALGEIPSPRTLEALLGMLEDPEPYVRSGATLGLADQAPVGSVPRFLERLDVEDDAVVRGGLYGLVAQLGDEQARARLLEHWGRPDLQDRREFLRGARRATGAWALPAMRAGVVDPESSVAVSAALSLRALGGDPALEALLPLVDSPDWPRAQTAIDALKYLGDSSAAPAIVRRLLDELAHPGEDPRIRLRVQKLLGAVVALGETSRLDELRAALTSQTDPLVREELGRDIGLLERIQRNGSSRKRWLAELESTDLEARMLTYDRLGRLGGGERVARVLVERFGRVETPEAVAILRTLGAIPSRASRDLVSRVLLEPGFDPAERAPLRDMAAWSARRLGGEAMVHALVGSIERRDGRDALPLFYLAVLDGSRALPLLERLRVPRLRYLKGSRGPEDHTLQRLICDLKAGRMSPGLDVPPERIDLH